MGIGRYSLILVDPLNGFCEPTGSLAKKYGEKELIEIRKTIPRIIKAVASSTRTHLVKSEYEIGQFTNGDKEDPLASLCVLDANEDCNIVSELSDSKFTTCTIKHEENALSSNEFKRLIDKDLYQGITKFIVAGFLLEHCVKATAEGLVRYIPNQKAEIVVCPDLSASRKDKYQNGTVENTKNSLKMNGVKIETWKQASP